MKRLKKIVYILNQFWEELLIKLFVDNVLLYKFVRCHRLSSRSFFVKNRQFHVCARCTGLIAGYCISVFLIPFRNYVAPLFPTFFAILLIDGLTQLLEWRQSNNTLRLITGLGTGSTVLPFIVSLWR